MATWVLPRTFIIEENNNSTQPKSYGSYIGIMVLTTEGKYLNHS